MAGKKRPTPERVKAVQELRRSSAATPVNRTLPRSAEKRIAIEQEKDHA